MSLLILLLLPILISLIRCSHETWGLSRQNSTITFSSLIVYRISFIKFGIYFLTIYHFNHWDIIEGMKHYRFVIFHTHLHHSFVALIMI